MQVFPSTSVRTSASARRKHIFFGIKILISVLVLAVLVRKISFHELSTAFIAAEKHFIVMAAALLALNLFLQTQKWRQLIRLEKPRVSRGEVMSSLLAGLTLGFITPGRLGELGRGFFIKDVSWQSVLGLTVIDKLVSLIVIYFAGLIGLSYFLQTHLHFYVWLPAVLTGIALILLVLFFLMRPDILRSLLQRFEVIWSNRSKAREFAACVSKMTATLTLKVLCLGILQYLTFILQFYLLIIAFAPLSLWQGFMAISAIMLVKTVLPIAIGDLGIRESAAIFFCGLFNVASSAALDASLLLFIINILLPSLAGLVIILIHRYNGMERIKVGRVGAGARLGVREEQKAGKSRKTDMQKRG